MALPAHANSDQEPFLASHQNQIFDPLFRRFESVAFLASRQHEPFKVAKAVEDYFGDFAREAIAVSVIATTRYARIVGRRRYQARIHTQSLDLIAELLDVADKNRMPAIRGRNRLEYITQYSIIANELPEKWLAHFHNDHHAKCPEHFAGREAEVPLRCGGRPFRYLAIRQRCLVCEP